MDETLNQDYKHLIGKPFLVGNFSWSTSSGIESILTEYNIPTDIQVNELVRIPFRSSCKYRMKGCLQFQVSGTALHSGILLVGSTTSEAMIGNNLVNSLLAGPHAFIVANESTPVCVEIPFYSPSKLRNCTLPSDLNTWNVTRSVDYAQVRVVVLNPLEAATSASTTLTVTAHFIFSDLEFYIPRNASAIYTALPTFGAEGFVSEGFVDKIKSSTTKLIDSTVTPLKTFTADFIDAGRMMLREYTGLHNPNQSFISDRKVVSTINFTNFTDRKTFFEKLDPFCDHDRICQDYKFNTDCDEMLIQNIVKKPQLLGRFNVRTTSNFGELVWARPIHPCMEALTASRPFSLTLLQNMAKHGRYWKGSLKIHIQSCMTNFHFCKLILIKDYSGTTLARAAIPTLTDITNYQTESIEFSAGGQIATITLPYYSVLNQSEVSIQSELNGVLVGMYYIYVQQPLIASANVPTTINFNVYVSAGDDFQLFGYPVRPMIKNTNLITLAKEVEPKILSREREKRRSSRASLLNSDLFKAEGLTDTLSQEDLDKEQDIMVNYDASDFRPIVSIRDILRRFQLVRSGSFAAQLPPNINSNYKYNLISVQRVTDLFYQMSSNFTSLLGMFAGLSGGLKFKIHVTGCIDVKVLYMPPAATNSSLPWLSPSSAYTADINVSLNEASLYRYSSQGLNSQSFGHSTVLKEVGIFSVPGFKNVANGEASYVTETEFCIPNMNTCDWTMLVNRGALVLPVNQGMCEDLGTLLICGKSDGPITNAQIDAGAVVYQIYMALADEARLGYQIYSPELTNFSTVLSPNLSWGPYFDLAAMPYSRYTTGAPGMYFSNTP